MDNWFHLMTDAGNPAHSSYLPFKGSDRTKKMKKGLIDLIIPNAAGPQVLKRLIDSLMNNLGYKIENAGEKILGLRIIVISQGIHGSHDYLTSLQREFPTIIFPVYKEKNFPPPIPYNDGLEYSATMMPVLSEYIMFLDDDMIMLKPGMIEIQLEHLAKYGFDNVATEHCYFGDKDKLGEHGEAKDFGMGSFLFKRKLFEKIGYLDEFFKFHCTDSDFNRRIRLWGGKIAVVPNTNQYMVHEHQRGTHNFFKGAHQAVIDNDWKDYAKKWFDHEHHNDIVDKDKCSRCEYIFKMQLPLGRKKYLING
jgi:hypothetical protein